MLDVLFINSLKELAVNQEINGTMLLATKLLQAGFRTDILRFCQIEDYHKNYASFIRNAVDKILSYEPKCVSFYSLWPNYHIILRLCREIKKVSADTIIVIGGPQASATASATMNIYSHVLPSSAKDAAEKIGQIVYAS
jgi:hypothetical protein